MRHVLLFLLAFVLALPGLPGCTYRSGGGGGGRGDDDDDATGDDDDDEPYQGDIEFTFVVSNETGEDFDGMQGFLWLADEDVEDASEISMPALEDDDQYIEAEVIDDGWIGIEYRAMVVAWAGGAVRCYGEIQDFVTEPETTVTFFLDLEDIFECPE